MRIPEWCVVVGLIGGGQEINVGEEGGLVQWRHAVEGCGNPAEWIVHGPPEISEVFAGSGIVFRSAEKLDLDMEIRFHLARDVDAWVEHLLGGDASGAKRLALGLEEGGYHLRMARDFDVARQYLKDRYSESSQARFGILASSRDRDLVRFGIENDFAATRHLRYGPWYGEGAEGRSSCRHLQDVVTEFGAQGLELDAVLLAWGTDLVRSTGAWSIAAARGYKRGSKVKDPFQLRVNAYRVLLTRGRDGTVAFVPPLEELDETAAYLESCGFRPLIAESS
jgi:hypothetical protein